MEVEFFPNPTSDISHLKINDDFDGLELYNFLGTRVFSCTGCSQIDLAPLPPGCYLAIVKLGPDKQDIKKIIIRK
jgi:hypothetical protein